MQMNDAGMALLRQFERCELTAYQDQGGVYTIGWGATGPGITAGLTWTQAQADQRLADDVQRTVDELLDMIDPELTDNQFSSQVVMAYNIGSGAYCGSSALTEINAEHLEADVRLPDGTLHEGRVPHAMRRWNKVRINGVLHISRGLVRRRAAEVGLWNKT